MARKGRRKSAAALMLSAALMGLDAILRPKEQQMETIRDETRRKKDAPSGEPPSEEQKQE